MKRMTCIRCYGGLSPNFDGLVKSPSVPLEAELRFNFVVDAHLVSALHSSVFARLASESFYETIVPVTFYENINFGNSLEFWKNHVTASVGARGPERNAPEASAGLALCLDDQSLFPSEEAGAYLPRLLHGEISAS
jgi:hypothetical protein